MNRLDPFSGNLSDPQSLHKYAYVHGDPVQGIDPSGLSYTATMSTISISQIGAFIGLAAVSFFAIEALKDVTISYPNINLGWLFATGSIIAIELKVAENIAEKSWEKHSEDFLEEGILNEEALVDLIVDIAEAGLAGEAGMLLKEGLRDGRTAVRDLATEILNMGYHCGYSSQTRQSGAYLERSTIKSFLEKRYPRKR